MNKNPDATKEQLDKVFDQLTTSIQMGTGGPDVDVEDEIDKYMEEFKDSLSPQEFRKRKEAFRKMYLEETSVIEAMGIKKEEIEAEYGNAYRLYNAGKYQQALDIFLRLNLADPSAARFNYAIASCYYAQKNYGFARVMYLRCMMMEMDNPIIYWYLADCYNKLGDKMTTLVLLEYCIHFASKFDDLKKIQIRAMEELRFVEKEVNEQLAAQEEKFKKEIEEELKQKGMPTENLWAAKE